MVSSVHQFILTLVARKMREIGFEPIAYDGDYNNLGLHKLNIPPKIINHRPDIMGINLRNEFCIGEVKTANDIFSIRTKNQFVDFLQFGNLIIGIPNNAKEILISRLKSLNILFNKNIILIEQLFLKYV